VILIDANLLLYAYNSSSNHHEVARRWLEEVFFGPEPVRLAWATILAFLRIGTNPRAFPYPFTPAEAVGIVSEWLERPGVLVLDPEERHWRILGNLLTSAQARGALVADAHLAALAIEHGAILCTSDRDFSRFPGLQIFNPLEQK
jgi:toxin-antitoxin system PIN domain toxin